MSVLRLVTNGDQGDTPNIRAGATPSFEYSFRQDCDFVSYQVMGIWIYIVGFHRRVKVPSVRSILYSTT